MFRVVYLLKILMGFYKFDNPDPTEEFSIVEQSFSVFMPGDHTRVVLPHQHQSLETRI